MAEINTNIILDGITLALRKAFPDSMITSNEVKQGLNVPAFIVRMVSFQTQAHPMQRHKNLPRFDIIYFPKADREECYSASDKLCKVLEVIALPSGDKVRGVDMSSEITDDTRRYDKAPTQHKQGDEPCYQQHGADAESNAQAC